MRKPLDPALPIGPRSRGEGRGHPDRLPPRRAVLGHSPRPSEYVIDRMGAAGDGGAIGAAGEPVHIPFTLPGERVLAIEAALGRASIDAILVCSPDRVEPPCPHFGICGGCALQHWADAPYAAWKSGRLGDALERAGLNLPALAPLARTPPAARRRMDLAVQRAADGVRLGLHQAHASRVVDLTVCKVLHPRLEALLAPLRELMSSLSGWRKSAGIAACFLPVGTDLLIRADGDATAGDRTRLASFAATHDVARIAWANGAGEPEVSAQTRLPVIRFAGRDVAPPPGAFLQASMQGEQAIVAAVLAALPQGIGPRSLIVELFAGVGTLSFPLAFRARVQAFEGNAAAAASLRRAAGGSRVEAATRDLARQPLQPAELKNAACIVLDPPFAGASAQMPAIAASGKPVVYVSCNPSTLGRDVAVLARAGYRLTSAVPIDQFLWSAQVETVCGFAKSK